MKKRYWLIPPDIYKKLDDEFHFDFDPCPYPYPEGYNGLEVDWGNSNWVNPPFKKSDNATGEGPAAWARKAIKEWKKGKTVVFIGPCMGSWWYNFLIEGAEIRPMGRVRYLECITKQPWHSPSLQILAVLRNNGNPKV